LHCSQLAAWLGLVPSLHQSGESETRGSITKTGSGYARRLLVEAAWHYTREPRIGVTLRSRQQGQPEQVLQIAWRAQHRLYRLHRRLRARGKPGNIAVVAAARARLLPLGGGPGITATHSRLARKAPGPKLPARAMAL
jgi:transposase